MDEQFKRTMERIWHRYYEAGENEKMPPDTLGIFNECFTYGCNAAFNERQKEIDELKAKLELAVSYLKEAKRIFRPNTTNSHVDDFIDRYDKAHLTEKEYE